MKKPIVGRLRARPSQSHPSELESSWRLTERVAELLAERDAATVLILPTFSVPLMTHGRTAFVQDDAEAARTQWRPHEETQSAQRERRLDHRAGLAQPLRIETAHDDLRADARRPAACPNARSRPPCRLAQRRGR